MKKGSKKSACVAVGLLAAFGLWTLLLRFVDVGGIGPEGSFVGFSKLNAAFHALTGVHMTLYTVTDWLGLVPIGVAFGFAILGIVQWARRKSLWRVDRDLFVLGGFYIVVMAVYLLFEVVVINYRPVLIEGVLEVSYPSSTTLLVLCVMPTAMMQLRARIKSRVWRRCTLAVMAAFTGFMLVGRLVSGVHWLTDIIGGALLGAGLVTAYHFLKNLSLKP